MTPEKFPAMLPIWSGSGVPPSQYGRWSGSKNPGNPGSGVTAFSWSRAVPSGASSARYFCDLNMYAM